MHSGTAVQPTASCTCGFSQGRQTRQRYVVGTSQSKALESRAWFEVGWLASRIWRSSLAGTPILSAFARDVVQPSFPFESTVLRMAEVSEVFQLCRSESFTVAPRIPQILG